MPPQTPLPPTPPAPQHHNEFFIIGSLFTVLMLLVASGILYFQNDSAPVVLQGSEQITESDFASPNTAKFTYSESDISGLKALVKVNSDIVIEADSRWDSFYSFSVIVGQGTPDAGSMYMIAQKQTDGSFVKIYAGQEIPSCNLVNEYKIPNQVLSQCSLANGQIVDAATIKTSRNTVYVSNYQSTSTQSAEYKDSSMDIDMGIEPFSDQRLKFTVAAYENVSSTQFSDYSFHFNTKGSYGVVSDQNSYGVEDDLLWLAPVGTSSIQDVIYTLEFAHDLTNDSHSVDEFKEFCPFITRVYQGRTYYGFGNPTPDNQTFINQEYGDTLTAALFCGVGRYLVLDGVIIANFKRPIDATELKVVNDNSITLIEATTAQTSQIPDGADAATYLILDDSFSIDKNHVYGTNIILGGDTQIIPNIDPKTFKLHVNILNANDPSDYAEDSAHLLYRPYATDVTPQGGFVDFATIKFLPGLGFNDYIKDSKAVYVTGQPYSSYQKILGADPSTFILLEPLGFFYATDASGKVYYFNGVVSGADKATFTIVEHQKTYDAQDKNRKYLRGEVVE